MDEEGLERRLDFWRQGLLVALGASGTLVAASIAEGQRASYSDPYLGWYFLWLIMWLAFAPPGFYLLMSRKWRKVSMARRFNIAYGYLGCAWLVLLSAGLRFRSSAEPCATLIVIAALVIGASYWYIRSKKDKPEELFP